jgi:hypothetical protein
MEADSYEACPFHVLLAGFEYKYFAVPLYAIYAIFWQTTPIPVPIESHQILHYWNIDLV